MESSKKVRRISRAKSRGAALVEGSLLFPVMVMFLPYMTYFHNIHKVSFVSMASSRAQVWEYTSKSCTGTTANPGTPSNDTASGSTPSGNSGPAESAVASKVANGIIATGYATVSGTADAKPFNVKFALTKPIKAESWNFCNELDYDVETTNMIVQMYKLGKEIVTTFL